MDSNTIITDKCPLFTTLDSPLGQSSMTSCHECHVGLALHWTLIHFGTFKRHAYPDRRTWDGSVKNSHEHELYRIHTWARQPFKFF